MRYFNSMLIFVVLILIVNISQSQAIERADIKVKPKAIDLQPRIDLAEIQLAGKSVPLQAAYAYMEKEVNGVPVYKDEYRECPINPGLIPPNYIHTWVVNVINMDKFRFKFVPVANNSIMMNNGDYLRVYDSLGVLLTYQDASGAIKNARFTSQPELQKAVMLTGYDPARTDQTKWEKRIFIELGTSSGFVNRRAILTGFVNLSEGMYPSEARAIIDADDLNYDKGGDLIQKTSIQGLAGLPSKPWPQHGPKPTADDAWYLLGRNTYSPQGKFCSLVYYNEAQSKLRLYLYNNIGDAMLNGYKMSLHFERSTGGVWKPMSGAFFYPQFLKQDSTIADYSHFDILLPVKWQYRDWVKVDIPILYPMEAAIPGSENLSCLYEDVNYGNVRLVIDVQSILKGDMSGKIDLTGHGTAVQELEETVKDNSTWGVLKKAGEAIQSGGSTGASIGGMLGSVVPGLGTGIGSAVGGFIGVLAAAFGFSDDDPVDPVPLKLGLTLTLQGKLAGDVEFAGQHFQNNIYLPGCFSYKSAVKNGEINPAEIDLNTSMMPRYDRSIGLFGFRKDPCKVRSKIDNYSCQYETGKWGGTYSFPHYDNAKGVIIEKGMPVIYNAYAEITPIPATSITPQADNNWSYFYTYGTREPAFKRNGSSPEYPYDRYYYWQGDVSWQRHIQPEPDDTSFPKSTTKIIKQKKDSIEQMSGGETTVVDYGEEQYGECSNMYITIYYPEVKGYGYIEALQMCRVYDDWRAAPWISQRLINPDPALIDILKYKVPEYQTFSGGFCWVTDPNVIVGSTGQHAAFNLIQTKSPVECALLHPGNSGITAMITPNEGDKPADNQNYYELSDLKSSSYYYSIPEPAYAAYYWNIKYLYYPRTRGNFGKLRQKSEVTLYCPIQLDTVTGSNANPNFNAIVKAVATAIDYDEQRKAIRPLSTE